LLISSRRGLIRFQRDARCVARQLLMCWALGWAKKIDDVIRGLRMELVVVT
jgi:hypothetical protein